MMKRRARHDQPPKQLTPEQRTAYTRRQIIAAYHQEVDRQTADVRLLKEAAALLDICRVFSPEERNAWKH